MDDDDDLARGLPPRAGRVSGSFFAGDIEAPFPFPSYMVLSFQERVGLSKG